MDTEHLKLFVDVARNGSFAETARLQERDPSQVSRVIANLETSLGVRLFQRSTRSLTLTEAGQHFLHRVEPILSALEVAEEETKHLINTPSGTLRMTASTAFGQLCLLPILPKFRETYPNINLDLKFTDDNLDLLSQEVDLACRLTPAFESELVGIKLFDTQYRVCATPEYIRRNGRPQSPDDLTEHDCLVFSMPRYRSRWLFKSKEAEIETVEIKSSIAISSALALRESAMQHMGPALLANWMVDEAIERKQLINLFPGYTITATDFETAAWLLYPSRHYLPLKTKAMINFLKGTLKR